MEDLLLVFPNFLQHKVSDFTLLDPTQPGTRKILCFFLVNPYERVLSTANVAPQQNGNIDRALYSMHALFIRVYQVS